jgi:hypothetical protein
MIGGQTALKSLPFSSISISEVRKSTLSLQSPDTMMRVGRYF